MAENSKIEWTDHTFNPWTGCTKVSPGCDHCYAEGWAKRSGSVAWGDAPRRRTTAANWKLPLKWNAQAEREGRSFRVFCASLADVFDNRVPAEWRRDLFNLILSTPSLDWLLLTKRIGNAARMIEETLPDNMKALPPDCPVAWPWPNVWIGATIVNQEEADRDIPKLLAVPAAKRFLSMEPLLGSVSFEGMFANTGDPRDGTNSLEALDWVIVGGESGPKARPMHPDWVRSLRDQCAAAGVPFLFKQWGEWIDHDQLGVDMLGTEASPLHNFGNCDVSVRLGKKAAGRLLDGCTHDGYPCGVALAINNSSEIPNGSFDTSGVKGPEHG
jgi:protein gp37